jgi:hypothetical protein
VCVREPTRGALGFGAVGVGVALLRFRHQLARTCAQRASNSVRDTSLCCTALAFLCFQPSAAVLLFLAGVLRCSRVGLALYRPAVLVRLARLSSSRQFCLTESLQRPLREHAWVKKCLGEEVLG